MAQASAELQVVVQTYDLLLWSCRHISNFPRVFRYTHGARLDKLLYRLLDCLISARYDPEDRRVQLRNANLCLERLRFAFRLARDLNCLSTSSYGHAVKSIDDIGRMVGGWLRSLDKTA
jgi:hypothetical protein